MDTPVMMPRFVFVHRINVSQVPEDKIQSYLTEVKKVLHGADKLPMLEYFIPVKDGPDYSLNILDLTDFKKAEL